MFARDKGAIGLVIFLSALMSIPGIRSFPWTADQAAEVASEMERVRLLEEGSSNLTNQIAGLTQKLIAYNADIASVKLNILALAARKTPIIGFQVRAKKYPPPIKDKQILKFDVIIQNRGEAYNKSTGIFTAPVEGLYMFWCNILNYDHDNYLSVYIYRDGRPLAYAYAPKNVYEGVASVTTTTFLRKGNQIWFKKFRGSENYLGAGWSSYGGTLVRAS